MKKQWIMGVLASALLMGCTTTETVVFEADSNQTVVDSFDQLNWQTVVPSKQVNFAIDETNQRYVLDSGQSAVASFEIDVKGKELELEILSHFTRTVFYPNAVLLNSSNQLVKTFTTEDFEYKHAYGFLGDRLSATAKIQPSGLDPIKLVIYTTPELIKGESEVLHPVKLDAIARGNYPPDVPNPVIPHAPYGQLSIIAKVDEAIVVEEAIAIDSSDAAHQKSKQDQAESVATAAAAVSTPMIVMGQEAAKPQSQLTESQQQYYRDSIKGAVEAGLIDKALSMLEEAKALGLKVRKLRLLKQLNNKSN
ncbi:MalM family protein [Vibrio mexicanus]|uniref:MalM family protein n=1 Tax=Vibrio mexicanus TaxID=1004326 RepID=UPI00063C3157|nr:MalM family protein [Vibrio mexicanus]